MDMNTADVDVTNGIALETHEGTLIMAFLVGGAAFGLEASLVQEVCRLGEITPVHRAPREVIGIRNLRGRIVTVIDLAIRLDAGKTTASDENRVLMIEWKNETVGLLVDAVLDTHTAFLDQLTPVPPQLTGADSQTLRGLFRCGTQLVAMLDLQALLDCGTTTDAT